ncbi:MAG: iron ABC transporter permease [Chloroflexaceae bacterium]|nr:iron ABC transporter permease [Chloroflexaceae bacterium]
MPALASWLKPLNNASPRKKRGTQPPKNSQQSHSQICTGFVTLELRRSRNSPFFQGFDGWTAVVIAIAGLLAVPVLLVGTSIFAEAGQVWQHLAETVLAEYLLNSGWLLLGVGVGTFAIGVGTAWLVTACRFPLSRLWEGLLLLPLAAPAYLLAYTYTEMLDYYGPVQSWLRSLFGWQSVQDYWFPDIRCLGGAIFMLVLVLYPYVYLLARAAFLEQAECTREASRCLGCNPWQSFLTVALPLARPAIAAGVALALMETLNDFGTVQYFGVNTFTTGIFRTWYDLGEPLAAAQLAAMLMVLILGLILLERGSRRQARYYQTRQATSSPSPYVLPPLPAFLAAIACLLPVVLGFVLPTLYLLHLSWYYAEEAFGSSFWPLARNSLLLAAITAAIAVGLSLILAYGLRLRPNWGMGLAVRVAALGYAIPGSAIAVGTMIPLGRLDNLLDSWLRASLGISTGLLLSGTVIALVFAYLVRFQAVSLGAVESSLTKIKPSLDDAARSLGYGTGETLWNVHVPLMWGGTLTGIMLVFVDVMKELPATLVIRPFNFDTLAIRVFQYASDERLVEAAAPALAIILVGLAPVLVLCWRVTRKR